MLLRANVLATGRSGCRPLLVETLFQMLAKGISPRVPEKGSVGASGDLAPLAHLALGMLGEGECLYKNRWVPSCEALSRCRHRARSACGQRRPGASEWNPMHGRGRRISVAPSRACGLAVGPLWSDGARSPARNARRLRRADSHRQASRRATRVRSPSTRASRRQRNPELASARRSASARCLLSPLYAASPRSRKSGPRPRPRNGGSGERDPPPTTRWYSPTRMKS